VVANGAHSRPLLQSESRTLQLSCGALDPCLELIRHGMTSQRSQEAFGRGSRGCAWVLLLSPSPANHLCFPVPSCHRPRDCSTTSHHQGLQHLSLSSAEAALQFFTDLSSTEADKATNPPATLPPPSFTFPLPIPSITSLLHGPKIPCFI